MQNAEMQNAGMNRIGRMQEVLSESLAGKWSNLKDAYDIMRQTWDSQQAGDRLVTRLWDEKHFFSRAMQEETLKFFDQWLKQADRKAE